MQLRTIPLSSLIAEFGQVEGHVLKNMGLAFDESQVIPYAQRAEVKSVGRNYCLPHNEYDKRVVWQNVYELCEEVALKLRKLGKKARTVGIYLGGDESISGRKTFGQFMNTGRDLFESIISITGTSGTFGYVRQIGIWTGNLEDAAKIPSPLLPRDQKEQKLAEIIDAVNSKFGDHTIRNGFLLYADRLTTVPNGYGASIRHQLTTP